MLFAITSLTEAGEWREFSFNASLLESGLDVVNRLSLQTEALIKVILIEGSSRLELPVEVFDGGPLSCPDPLKVSQ